MRTLLMLLLLALPVHAQRKVLGEVEVKAGEYARLSVDGTPQSVLWDVEPQPVRSDEIAGVLVFTGQAGTEYRATATVIDFDRKFVERLKYVVRFVGPPPPTALPAVPARPGKRPAVEEIDAPPGVTPRGVRDDRMVASASGHPLYDHPAAKAHLARAAESGVAVVKTGHQDGTPVTWTFRPDGLIDRTTHSIQASAPPQPAVIPPPGGRPGTVIANVPPGRYESMPARGPVARQPFLTPNVLRGTASARGGEVYDPDHNCNRCGAEQLAIQRWNSDGTHTHKCSRCGHSWRHRD